MSFERIRLAKESTQSKSFVRRKEKKKGEDERKREEGNLDGGGKRADASLETLISISVFMLATVIHGAST